MASFTLPKDFLLGPSPKMTKEKIDFKKIDLEPDYNDLYAVILENAFSKSECEMLTEAVVARTGAKWEAAMVNVGYGEQKMIKDARDCGRIIYDDRELVAKIWSRVEDAVPEIRELNNMPKVTGNGPAKRKETWRMSRCNERMRFLKYGAGQYFRPHCDGTYVDPDTGEMSFYTLHLYLDESSPESPEGVLKGGATTFHDWAMKKEYNVEPKIGRVLIFQHRDLLHSGADVESGIKLTMRTDLMYQKVKEDEKF